MDDEAAPAVGDLDRQTDLPGLAAAVSRLSRASVLVVGDAMLNRYVHGRVGGHSGGAPILAVQREIDMPGGAGNLVRHLTALGAAVAFVSVVGDDQTGSDLTGLIGGQPGVEPWLLVQGGRTTPRKTRYLAADSLLLRTDREDADAIHAKLAERLVRIAREAMAATSLTVLSDHAKGVLSGAVSGSLIAAARQTGRRVVVDPRGADHDRFAGADVITPTAAELAAATGMPAGTDDEAAAAARALRQRLGFGAVLVLRARLGVTLVDETEVARHFPPRDVPASASGTFNPIGVSDSIVATLAAGLATGLALPVASELAGLAGNIVAGDNGAGVAREADLLAALPA